MTPQQEARVQLITAANHLMQADKRAALAAYDAVCPRPQHARCTDRCHDAHKQLLSDMSDANALYSSRIWGPDV